MCEYRSYRLPMSIRSTLATTCSFRLSHLHLNEVGKGCRAIGVHKECYAGSSDFWIDQLSEKGRLYSARNILETGILPQPHGGTENFHPM
jgi:hypothetical protein